MSVLSFPRIYFQGLMEWDPCTFNNNDWQTLPTYDAANAALNWSFLATEGPIVPPGITQENFTMLFRPWAITLQQDSTDDPPGQRVPAEWNMFGSHAVNFVQYNDLLTTVTGGDLGYGQPSVGDPVIGGAVTIGPDSTSSAARLVDINPASFWSSQIYYGTLGFGSGNYQVSGPRSLRMHSRWLNLNRIYTTDSSLTQPAAAVACCFQACIPFDQVVWPNMGSNPSPLITMLKSKAATPPAQGIMMRFTAYVNVYFKNGILNNIPITPGDYKALATALANAWNEWQTSGGSTSLFFSNPCYSHIVGAVGLWNEGELQTVPGGRYLVADNDVAPSSLTPVKPVPNAARSAAIQRLGHHTRASKAAVAPASAQAATATATATAPITTALGPVVIEVDYNASLISLDFNSAMPENGTLGAWPSDLTKTDFGSLTLGVQADDGTFTSIVDITYDQYQQSAYEGSAGIIDIPFPDSGTGPLLQSGALAIQVQGQTALLEQAYTAQTDTRGIYLDEGGQTDFNILVCQGGAPSPAVNVLIAQYDAGLNLIPSSQPPLVTFTNGEQSTVTSGGGDILTNVTVVTSDQNGIATAGIAAALNGFPTLAFFPYATSGTMPQPPDSLAPPGPSNAPGWGSSVTYAFYTTIRVLPFDDDVPDQFIELWNTTHDPQLAWQFVYNNILYLYDMLFNVMLEFVDLGDQAAVVASIGYIWPAISVEWSADDTGAMPITRDLSAGKRTTLQLWMYTVSEGFAASVTDISIDSIPPDWTPPPPSKH